MKRRKAREYALQILFQLDIRKEKPSAVVLKHFWAEYDPDEEVKTFSEEIVKGTYKHIAKIDELLHRCAKNWSLDRMAVVDRNVLRMAVYEILCDVLMQSHLPGGLRQQPRFQDCCARPFRFDLADRPRKLVRRACGAEGR